MQGSSETLIEPTPRQTVGGCLFGLGLLGIFAMPLVVGRGPGTRPYDFAALAILLVGLATMLWGRKLGPTPRSPESWRDAVLDAAKIGLGVGAMVFAYRWLHGDPKPWRPALRTVPVVFVVHCLMSRFPFRPLRDDPTAERRQDAPAHPLQ